MNNAWGWGDGSVVKAQECNHEDPSFKSPEPVGVLGRHDSLPAVPTSESGEKGSPEQAG